MSLIMKNLLRAITCFLLSTFLAIGSHALAQDQPGLAGGYHPLLWEIKGTNHSVFLFGSIHIAKPDFYPLPDYIEQAYRQADVVAVEVDPSAAGAGAKMAPFITYAAPDKLQKHLTPGMWQRVAAKLGPTAEQVQPMKPAMLSVLMSLGVYGDLGYAPQAGIDLHFISRAKADNKSLVELETIEFQAAVLGGLNDQDGESMLKQMLDGMENGEAIDYANRIADGWKSGNAAGLVQLFEAEARQDPGSAHVMKLLIDDRNPEMARKIARLFTDGKNAFVVVGVGHLVGSRSVVDLLQKQGLDVRQLH